MACPPHYSFVSLNSTPPCLPSCPLEYYSKYQYSVFNWTHFTFSLLSIPLSLFAIICYIFIPERRKWPGVLLIGIFIAVVFVGIGGILPVIVYGKDDWIKLSCNTNVSFSGRKDGLCVFSFILNYGAAMFGASMWCCLALNLCVTYFKVKISHKIFGICSYGYCFLTSLTGIITALSGNAVIGQPPNAGCFLDPSKSEGWYYDGLWTIPLSVMFVVGSAAVLSVCGNLGVKSYKITEISWSARPLIQFLGYNKRILAFLGVYWYAVLMLNSYRFYLLSQGDRFENSVILWYGCLYQTWGSYIMNGTLINEANIMATTICGKPEVPGFVGLVFVSLSVAIAATAFPLVFISDMNLLRWAYYKIQGKEDPNSVYIKSRSTPIASAVSRL